MLQKTVNKNKLGATYIAPLNLILTNKQDFDRPLLFRTGFK